DEILNIATVAEDGWLDNIMVRVLKTRRGGLMTQVRRIDPPTALEGWRELLKDMRRGPAQSADTHNPFNQAAPLRESLRMPEGRPHRQSIYKVAEGYGLAAESAAAEAEVAAARAAPRGVGRTAVKVGVGVAVGEMAAGVLFPDSAMAHFQRYNIPHIP